MSRPSPALDRLVAELRAGLLSGLVPGEALPGERELAARHGVARETVRAALRELMRVGIIGQRNGRHTVRQARADADSVLILSRFNPLSGNPVAPGYDAAVTLAVRASIDRSGLRASLLDPALLAGGGALRVLARPPAALVIAPDAANHAEAVALAAALSRRGLPVVAEAEPEAQPQAETVQHDHASGGAAVTAWLIARGCRRILPLWRFPGRPPWIQRREAGYRSAMQAAGLEPLTAVRTGDLPGDNSGDHDAFMRSVRGIAGALPEHLCRHDRIDALLLATDAHAVQAAAALRLFGLVPNRDVLLAGYDATWPWERSRRLEPQGPLVTCDKDEAGLAEAITARVVHRLAGKSGEKTRFYHPGRLMPIDPALYEAPYRDPWA